MKGEKCKPNQRDQVQPWGAARKDVWEVRASSRRAIRLRNPGLYAARQCTGHLAVVGRDSESLDLINAVPHRSKITDALDFAALAGFDMPHDFGPKFSYLLGVQLTWMRHCFRS